MKKDDERKDKGLEILHALKETTRLKSKYLDPDKIKLKADFLEIMRNGDPDEFKEALVLFGVEEGSEELTKLMDAFYALRGRGPQSR